MKMGTSVSPWRCEEAADHALKPARLRWTAILGSALRAAPFLNFAGGI